MRPVDYGFGKAYRMQSICGVGVDEERCQQRRNDLLEIAGRITDTDMSVGLHHGAVCFAVIQG